MPETRVHVRWMNGRDMPSVLNIEAACFEFPWRKDDFIRCLRHRNCIGMVAEGWESDEIVGYMIYELHSKFIHILNFAVAPAFWHQTVGWQLVKKLKAKLHVERRSSLSLEVRETNLSAQLFFRTQGFRATMIFKGFYEDTTEDAYRMVYSISEVPQFYSSNRFSSETSDCSIS